MLDRERLAHKLSLITNQLFPDLEGEHNLARATWNKITRDDSFQHRADCAQSSFLIPRWEGNLLDTHAITAQVNNHCVLSVDGSQIYPDRHVAGAGCFLINTGGVLLRYGAKSSAIFFSSPHVLLPFGVVEEIGDVSFSRDLVDFKREEYELSMMLQKALEHKPVCFVDGSLVFWPLESKPAEIKTFFLNKYLFYLEEFYKNKIPIVGYISMPKSRELVNLIKLGLCRFAIADCIKCHSAHDEFPCKQVDRMVDTHVARFFLGEYERTTVFYSTSKIVEEYPEQLRPAFVYCNVGSEIVRLEVPAWIAQDKELLDYVCAVAIDQSKKGRGYPVCLAEAHEQAVVKGGDRDFFYHLLCKIGIDQNKAIRFSEKSKKKRGIGV